METTISMPSCTPSLDISESARKRNLFVWNLVLRLPLSLVLRTMNMPPLATQRPRTDEVLSPSGMPSSEVEQTSRMAPSKTTRVICWAVGWLASTTTPKSPSSDSMPIISLRTTQPCSISTTTDMVLRMVSSNERRAVISSIRSRTSCSEPTYTSSTSAGSAMLWSNTSTQNTRAVLSILTETISSPTISVVWTTTTTTSWNPDGNTGDRPSATHSTVPLSTTTTTNSTSSATVSWHGISASQDNPQPTSTIVCADHGKRVLDDMTSPTSTPSAT